MVTARLDFEDAKMAYDDEVDTLKAVAKTRWCWLAKEAAEDWETFHEFKNCCNLRKIKRLRSEG